jgi:hypothetical protein
MAKDKNGTRAAIAAGVPEKNAASMASQWLNPELFPLVAYEAQKLLARLEETAILDAEEIRRRIHEVVNFCPADWFTPLGRHGWAISMEDYRKLPTHIRRMIEEMELTNIRIEDQKSGRVVEKELLGVKFISKSLALGLAAKYGLTEKQEHNVNVMTVNWDELYDRQAHRTKENPVERRIREARTVNSEPCSLPIQPTMKAGIRISATTVVVRSGEILCTRFPAKPPTSTQVPFAACPLPISGRGIRAIGIYWVPGHCIEEQGSNALALEDLILCHGNVKLSVVNK